MAKVLAGLLLWHSLSLSPALSQELCVGAEAPGVPSSEPHCRCGHLLLGDTFLRCCSSCGPLSSLMDNWGTVPQLQSRSPAEFSSSRCPHLKVSDIFFSFLMQEIKCLHQGMEIFPYAGGTHRSEIFSSSMRSSEKCSGWHWHVPHHPSLGLSCSQGSFIPVHQVAQHPHLPGQGDGKQQSNQEAGSFPFQHSMLG